MNCIKSTLLLCLLVFFGCLIEVQGQEVLFYQKVSENINVDNVKSVARSTWGEIALLEIEAGGDMQLSIITSSGDNLYDLSAGYSHVSYDDANNLFLTDNNGTSYLFNKIKGGIDKDEKTTIDKQKLASYPYEGEKISVDGYLNGKAYFNPLSDVNYVFDNDAIYRQDSVANSYFKYYSLGEGELALDVRLARKLSDGRWLVGFNEFDKLFLFDGERSINVFKLSQNLVHTDKKLKIFHAAEAYGKVYLSANDFRLYVLDPKSLKVSLVYENDLARFKNIVVDSKGDLFCGSLEGDIFQINRDHTYRKIIDPLVSNNVNSYRFYEDRNGWHWWGFSKGMTLYIPKLDKAYHLNKNNYREFRADQVSTFSHWNEELYIGTYINGVFKLDYPQLESYVNLCLEGKKDFSWDSVEFNRLAELDPEVLKVARYFQPIGDEYLTLRSDGELWVFKNNGEVFKLDEQDGFVSEMANFFASEVDGGMVNSLPNGFSLFYPERYLQSKRNQELCLLLVRKGEETLEVSQQNMDTYDLGKLDEDYNYLQFKLAYCDKTRPRPDLEYRMDNSSQWSRALNDVIVASTDAVGDHHFEVRPRHGNVNLSPLTIAFTITQKWYKTKSFYYLVVGLGGFLLFYLVRTFLQRKRLERSLKMMETESLRSYMNPHFISNSLNSINYYILQNDHNTASNYIVKFSKLIRRILTNSEMEFISLEEEIESLRNYIEIEQMRFEGKFDYEIIVSSEVVLTDKIASFVLQPIVENAIWHGIIQKVGKGHLQIKVDRKDLGYEVTVKDDGVGYKASKEIKSKSATKRKSYGMKMIEKRLHLLDDIYGYNHSFEVKDRLDVDEVKGTIATVFFNIHNPESK